MVPYSDGRLRSSKPSGTTTPSHFPFAALVLSEERRPNGLVSACTGALDAGAFGTLLLLGEVDRHSRQPPLAPTHFRIP